MLIFLWINGGIDRMDKFREKCHRIENSTGKGKLIWSIPTESTKDRSPFTH